MALNPNVVIAAYPPAEVPSQFSIKLSDILPGETSNFRVALYPDTEAFGPWIRAGQILPVLSALGHLVIPVALPLGTGARREVLLSALAAQPIVVTAPSKIIATSGLAVAAGDSLFANGSGVQGAGTDAKPIVPANGITFAQSLPGQYARATGGAFRTSVNLNYGLGGDTSSAAGGNVGLIARLPTAISAAQNLAAGILFANIGTNDPAATRTANGADGTNAMSGTNMAADFAQIASMGRSAGLVVLFRNMSPRGDTLNPSNAYTGTPLQYFKDARTKLNAMHNPAGGVYVWDPFPLFVNDANACTVRDGYTLDGLHPNGLMSSTEGAAFASWAQGQGFLPANPIVLPGATALAGALNTNPDMPDTNGDGLADGWSLPNLSGVTVTPSNFTDAGGLHWQRFQGSGNAASAGSLTFGRTLTNPTAMPSGRLSDVCQYSIAAGSTGLESVSLTLRQSYTNTANGSTVQSFLPNEGQGKNPSDSVPSAASSGTLVTEAYVSLPSDLTAITSLVERALIYVAAGPVTFDVMFRGFDARWNRFGATS